MEVDEEDHMAVWRDPNAHPTIPDDFIKCPLSDGELKDYYSLSHQGAPNSYLNQERAMRRFFSNPPLTKEVPTTPSSSKKGKANMKALAPATLELRVRTMDEFIGFCAKWLNLTPTMEHALSPQVVAKYMGFHVAKGSEERTLKRIATQLHQSITFITHKDFPSKHSTHVDAPSLKALDDWYSNLNGKIMASISTHKQAIKKGVTLWSVWEASLSKWQAFQANLKVSGDGCPCVG